MVFRITTLAIHTTFFPTEVKAPGIPSAPPCGVNQVKCQEWWAPVEPISFLQKGPITYTLCMVLWRGRCSLGMGQRLLFKQKDSGLRHLFCFVFQATASSTVRSLLSHRAGSLLWARTKGPRTFYCSVVKRKKTKEIMKLRASENLRLSEWYQKKTREKKNHWACIPMCFMPNHGQ